MGEGVQLVDNSNGDALRNCWERSDGDGVVGASEVAF